MSVARLILISSCGVMPISLAPPKSNSVDNEWFQQHALQNKVGGGPGYFISKGVG